MTDRAELFGAELIEKGLRKTDLICIGRGIADLYADQLGGRLEDAISFSAYVGGSALNICVGVARLDLQTAMVLRLGNDHMGRLVNETMERNNVNTAGVIFDPVSPTPLCILGVRNRSTFPRDLFTNDGAYLNLTKDDLDPQMFNDARAVLINGSFFATEPLRETCHRALDLARECGCATALDIDYRPALWGLVGHGSGDSAFVESAEVTEIFSEFLPMFDLIVGTEEEIAVAGGSIDSLQAVNNIRANSDATIVLKRGAAGCVAFRGPIPDDLEKGVVVPGFPVEVMNTAGAGDSFMAGLVAGWLTDQSLPESCRIANACGAINVSRHGCSDSAPSRAEVEVFIEEKATQPDESLAMRQLHSLLGRQTKSAPLNLMDLCTAPLSAGLAKARSALANSVLDGILCPADVTFADLAELTGQGLWIARRMRVSDDFLGGIRAVSDLRHWPREHILCVSVADLPDLVILIALAKAAAETQHEIVVDLTEANDPRAMVEKILEENVQPEWWLLKSACVEIESMLSSQRIQPRGVISRETVQN